MEPPFDLAHLRQLVRDGKRPKFLFFWAHVPKPASNGRECLSQWFPASFCVDGVQYPTAEHYMMAEKARLFGDSAMLERILTAGTPAEAKKLGRCISGFSESVWNENRFHMVVEGNLAKFQQNGQLRSYLLGTGDRVIVEASLLDRIWGIGMTASDPGANDPEIWKGLNLLGFALMQARYQIRQS